MKDTELYEQLLGLSKPWSVSRVDMELEHDRVTVHVECAQGTLWADPETGQDRAHIHGWVERSWRHLDTCQFETRIVAKVPRLKYASGRVEDAAVPWAEREDRKFKRPFPARAWARYDIRRSLSGLWSR